MATHWIRCRIPVITAKRVDESSKARTTLDQLHDIIYVVEVDAAALAHLAARAAVNKSGTSRLQHGAIQIKVLKAAPVGQPPEVPPGFTVVSRHTAHVAKR